MSDGYNWDKWNDGRKVKIKHPETNRTINGLTGSSASDSESQPSSNNGTPPVQQQPPRRPAIANLGGSGGFDQATSSGQERAPPPRQSEAQRQVVQPSQPVQQPRRPERPRQPEPPRLPMQREQRNDTSGAFRPAPLALKPAQAPDAMTAFSQTQPQPQIKRPRGRPLGSTKQNGPPSLPLQQPTMPQELQTLAPVQQPAVSQGIRTLVPAVPSGPAISEPGPSGPVPIGQQPTRSKPKRAAPKGVPLAIIPNADTQLPNINEQRDDLMSSLLQKSHDKRVPRGPHTREASGRKTRENLDLIPGLPSLAGEYPQKKRSKEDGNDGRPGDSRNDPDVMGGFFQGRRGPGPGAPGAGMATR